MCLAVLSSRPQEAFAELDKDGDGHLTPAELHAALRNTGALAKAGLAAEIDPHVLEVRAPGHTGCTTELLRASALSFACLAKRASLFFQSCGSASVWCWPARLAGCLEGRYVCLRGCALYASRLAVPGAGPDCGQRPVW